MATGGEEAAGVAGFELEQGEKKEDPLTLRVKVHAARGCPEETQPLTVSYRLDISKWEEDGAWEGTSEPPEEGGVDQTITFENQHQPPPSPEQQDANPVQFAAFLHTLVKTPMEFKVAGLAAGDGKFAVNLVDLIWQPPRDPDDDDDGPRLPRVSAWFPVVRDSEEASEFPEGVEVHVTVELNMPVVREDEIKDVNVIQVTMKSLYQLPTAWMLKEDENPDDHPYTYTLRFSLPGVYEATQVTVQPGRVVPPPPPPEPGAEGEEAGADAAAEGEGEGEEGGDRVGGNVEVPASAAVEEWYKLQRTDREVSSFAEAKMQSIEFEHTHSEFLLPIACKNLKQSFMDKTLFPVEISRTLTSGADYRYEKKYHGLAHFDISSISHTDVTVVTLRCPIGPHLDFEAPTEEDMESIPEDEREDEERLHDGTAANPYLLAETYLVLEIRTHLPLSPKPPPPPAPLASVRDIISKRPAVPVHEIKHTGVDRFKDDIKAVIAELQELYSNPSAPLGDASSPAALEARRTQLVCHLSETGKMHDFKAKLKESVAMIIREKFKQTPSLNHSEGADMIAELNAALREEINNILFSEFPTKKILSPGEKPPSTADSKGGARDSARDALVKGVRDSARDKSARDSAREHLEEAPSELQLILDKEKRLAVEAEVNLDYGKAVRHLNRRVVASPKNPQLWYDLGATVLRSGDIAKAQECFRQAVTEDSNHLVSLLAFAILFTIRDKYGEADKYFKEAVSAAPNDVLSWSCAVLFYDLESKDGERRTALKQMQNAEKKAKVTKRSPYLRAAQLCLELGSTLMVERAMTQELHVNGDSVELQVMLGRAYLANGQWDKCRGHLLNALEKDKKCSVAMTLMGHSHYMEFGWPAHRADTHMPLPQAAKEVMQWYDKALNTKPPWASEMLQFIRLAKIQIVIKKFFDAQDTLRKATNLEPSATVWLGRAIALYHMGEFDRAEEALQEAAVLDDHNPQVWALNTIVALTQATSMEGTEIYQPKADEAQKCFQRALQGGINTTETFPTNDFLLTQIGTLFIKIGSFESAAAAFRRALLDARGPEAVFALNKSLAECAEAIGDIHSALGAYKKCGELASTRPEYDAALKNLVKISQQLQNTKEASRYNTLLKKETWVQGQAL